jgi:hypothetical protein
VTKLVTELAEGQFPILGAELGARMGGGEEAAPRTLLSLSGVCTVVPKVAGSPSESKDPGDSSGEDPLGSTDSLVSRWSSWKSTMKYWSH